MRIASACNSVMHKINKNTAIALFDISNGIRINVYRLTTVLNMQL